MNILMLPIPAGKPWNGATLYQEPLGGSESAVAFLARSFARKGHRTTVATHGQTGMFDGVFYRHIQDMPELIQFDWDAVISSRWFDILKEPWKTRAQLIWFHDMCFQQALPVRAQRAVMLSQAQADSWMLDPTQTVIIGNGIDTGLFAGAPVARSVDEHGDPNVLLWTSNPDRGLALAAKIFQEIRKRWPTLELHVYGRAGVYGWGPEAEAPYMPRPEHMENVTIHEPVNKLALAQALRKAWAWYYPTYWPETYCIAALEAQAAGTPVITVPLAALNETVKGGVVTYDILNAVSQLRNKSKWQKESGAGKAFAMTRDWDLVANEWLAAIEQCQAETAAYYAKQ